ncbi:hypothetical protein ACI784_07440 [Geodermatophilus sp. SYSU D01186]
MTDPRDVQRDLAAGLNTYVVLTDNTDLDLVRGSGMSAITSLTQDPLGEGVGTFLADEADMWAGAGDGAWTGNYPGQGDICSPATTSCGMTVMSEMARRAEGRSPAYANYGKGVMFWAGDADAARFVNEWPQLAVSSDLYWYTDPHICTSPSEGPSVGAGGDACRRAANYGLVVDRMRYLDGLDGLRQPIWAFVEVGHPFIEDDAPTITGPQVQGAVMNSVIHEARGIVYFNHSFGGSCISQHVLRDCDPGLRASVAQVNAQLSQLAPVLNTQSRSWSFNPALDTMMKIGPDGAVYVFAMLGRDTPPGTYRLDLPSGVRSGTAEVLFEDRSVPMRGRQMADTFETEHSYHVYRLSP